MRDDAGFFRLVRHREDYATRLFDWLREAQRASSGLTEFHLASGAHVLELLAEHQELVGSQLVEASLLELYLDTVRMTIDLAEISALADLQFLFDRHTRR